MKKVLTLIIIAICAVILSVGLVACNSDGSATIGELCSEYGITVSGGGFDNDCKLIANAVSSQEDLGKQILKTIEGENYNKSADVNIFDIHVEKDGEKVQPNGKVTISIPFVPQQAVDYLVFHVKDSGAAEKLVPTVEEKCLKVEVSSFSYFVVAEKAEEHEHVYGEWMPSNDGVNHERLCECGETQKESHQWDNGEVSNSDGVSVIIYTCTVCKTTKTEQAPVTHEHVYGEWMPSNDGVNHERLCNCGETQKESHQWDNGEVSNSDGVSVIIYTCTVCKTTKTEQAPVTHEHVYGEWMPSNDGVNHERLCECGETQKESHQWDNGEVSNSDGVSVISYTCTVCKTTKTEQVPVTHEHSGEWMSSNDGVNHERLCNCGETQKEPHQWDNGEVEKVPSDGAEGIMLYRCTVCGTYKQESIPKTDYHVFGAWEELQSVAGKHHHVCECGAEEIEDCVYDEGEVAVAPTHSKEGLTIYTCTICGAVKQVVTAATAEHEYSEWVYLATPTGAHQHQRVCECGAEEIEDCTPSDWIIDEEPGCVNEGVQHKECTKCGHELANEYIESWGGHIVVVDNAVPATCTESGLTEGSHCNRCESVLVEQEVVPAGHHYDDGICTVCGESDPTQPGLFDANGNLLVTYEKSLIIVDYNYEYGTNQANEFSPYRIITNSYSTTKRVVLPEDLRFIGNSAFEGCDMLTSVFIPDSVTIIGNHAFDGCANLAEVVLPNSVLSVDSYAFAHCTSLQSVVLPNSVLSVDSYAFCNCTSLQSVVLPGELEELSENVFNGCESLRNVVIPDSVQSIGSGAFYNCSSLSVLTIPENVTDIGDEAFYNCTGLTAINYNATQCTDLLKGNQVFYVEEQQEIGIVVTVGNNVTRIPAYLFYNENDLKKLPKITKLIVGTGVQSIGARAFVLVALKELYYNAENCEDSNTDSRPFSMAGNGNDEGVAVTIGNNVRVIPASMFHWSKITTLVIGENVTSINNRAFYDCQDIKEIYYNAIQCNDLSDENNVFYNAGNAVRDVTLTIGNKVKNIPAFLFGGTYFVNSAGPYISKIVFEGNSVCTSIGESAFEGRDLLKSVVIADSVTNIGTSAFEGCYYLENLVLGNSVTEIGESAFKGCYHLESVVIGDSVKKIGKYAFNGCYCLKSVVIGTGVNYISRNAFGGCQLTSVTFKDTTVWEVIDGETLSSTKLDAGDLADTAIAAEYLKDTYKDYYWQKKN